MQKRTKIEKLLVLCLLILASSCQTTDASRYFKKPKLKPACISNGDGTCYEEGELVEDTTNWLCTDPDNFDEIEKYHSDKEQRLYICLRYGRCR